MTHTISAEEWSSKILDVLVSYKIKISELELRISQLEKVRK